MTALRSLVGRRPATLLLAVLGLAMLVGCPSSRQSVGKRAGAAPTMEVDAGGGDAGGSDAGEAGPQGDAAQATEIDAGPGQHPLPACAWPARLDDLDAAVGTCHAARRMLTCELSGGATQGCLSDDAQCPAEGSGSPVKPCEDVCQPDEYAAACGAIGAIGPSTVQDDPPVGCHDAMPTPGGVVFYCCPCE